MGGFLTVSSRKSVLIWSAFLVSVIITVTVISSVCGSEQHQCHESVGRKALDFLSTKRPYRYPDQEGSTVTPEGCTPVKLWYFGRHGTRYPGAEDIAAMQTVLPKLHAEILAKQNYSELCPETLEYFSRWRPRPDLNLSNESHLHSQGEYEISAIASRLKTRYPNLFPQHFTNESYFFKFTKSQRTEASAHSFASSIFGHDQIGTVYFPKPLSKDPILKFYSVCPKWEEEVDGNPEANKEHDLFVISALMNKTISNVSKRSGLERNLTLEEITILYTTCAFETAWNNGTLSEWCVLFDLEDFKVLEYREDLDYYWKDGYGFKINWEQACPPFADALKFFREYGSNLDSAMEYRKVQAYFSHSGANLKMLARLGLFNGDNPVDGGTGSPSQSLEIRHDNFEEMKDIYEWRTSQIDFMGSNIAFVLYSCDDKPNQIGFFTQELPTRLPACQGQAFCSFDEFAEEISKFTNDCNLERICSINQ